ncbi:ATP-binding protein [Vibrio methylphosphonaticus]|uniref:ATP-binding protein n=1 Tax=Vibrio methylphosphonaticus TaxID=2946866 RepID=UPI00202A1277|nr:ATP-binding protein [Vibrio methylphosphonaticus]MCL9776693.1 ATP-binding protein [Vibrio methylphosphonaticus]
MPNANHHHTRNIRKTLVAGSAIVLCFLALFFYTEYRVNEAKNQLTTLKSDILTASNGMLLMRRHEKDFIARVEPEYIEKMQTSYHAIMGQLSNVNVKIIQSGIETDYSNQYALSYIDDYVQSFFALADLVVAIHGDNTPNGLIDNLREQSLRLGNELIKANSTTLDYTALTMQDLMYQFFSDFNVETLPRIERILKQMENEITQQPQSFALFSAFLEFKLAFYSLQSAYEEFGYTHNEGRHGALRATVHQLETKLNTLFDVLPNQIANKIAIYDRYRLVATIALVVAIILTLLYVIRQTSILETKLITAREHERQANRAKSAFLANMSHEIRTPLNGILGMTEILSDSKLSALQKDYLSTIGSSSQTLLMLINDILDLSKIESGHLEICPHTCAIKEVVFDTAALIAPKAQQKGIELAIEIDPTLPNYVKADEQKVRQVLMNLASNAIKFTESGSITFIASLIKQQANSVTVYLAVKDTGIGIDSNKQAHIFDEFQQEDASTSSQYGGTGLGLAISSKMIAMMGGDITLHSLKGQGSEFSFTLLFDNDDQQLAQHTETTVFYVSLKHNPLLVDELNRYGFSSQQIPPNRLPSISPSRQSVVIIDDAETYHQYKKLVEQHRVIFLRNNQIEDSHNDFTVSAFITYPLLGARLSCAIKSVLEQVDEIEPTETQTNADAGSSAKILIVEDNKVNQQIVTINLNKLGINYLVANDGQEALAIYQQQHDQIGLILMDCMMPIMDGFDATEAIRAYESSRNLPNKHIIALTASVLDDDIQKCFDCGMDDYLPKPFKRDVLIEKLDKQVNFFAQT